MILVHFFLRTIKKREYLMAESSATRGSSPLWTSPETLFETDPSVPTEDLAERARKRVMDAFPKLVYVRTFYPKKRKDSSQAFDMTFKEEKEASSSGRKTILQKLGLK